MRVKIQQYEDNRVIVHEDYDGVSVKVGKAKPVTEFSAELAEKDIQSIKTSKNPLKKIEQLKKKL